MPKKRKPLNQPPRFIDHEELKEALRKEDKRQQQEILNALLEDREITFDSPVLEELFRDYGGNE
ncbi:hypothetical protein [Chroococcidiopsis sp. CCMEE 29]|uniref:hypothetical protein n=1 Tax=Chroococcidiopsis sp. CCMEE 29 TaxID=155894 RepID=UPI002020393A|nr:hypothetical protein [Chroococcidiopsis sp. CCMEE 29]